MKSLTTRLSLLVLAATALAACGTDSTGDSDGSGDAGDIGGVDAGADVAEDGTSDDTGTDSADDTDPSDDAEEDTEEDAEEDTEGDTEDDGGSEDVGEDTTPEDVCGDNITGATEQCDDANVDDTDGCNTSCQFSYQVTALIEMRGFPVAGIRIDFSSAATEVGGETSEDVGEVMATLSSGTWTATPSLPGYLFEPASIEVVIDGSGPPSELSFELVNAPYPTADDAWVDSSRESPQPYVLGSALQAHAVFPDGNDDWYSVELEEGVAYEFFTTNLSLFSDTVLEIYLPGDTGVEDSDDASDDYDYLDSHLAYTAPSTGTYLVRIRQFDDPCGVVSYVFAGVVLNDPDNDESGDFYDCNQSDETIEGNAEDIFDDGVDQDCNGFERATAVVADGRSNDTAATAVTLTESTRWSPERAYSARQEGAPYVLTSATDVDWFTFTVPANGKATIGFRGLSGDASTSSGLRQIRTLYGADATTEIATSAGTDEFEIENDTETDAVYYLSVQVGDGFTTLQYFIGYLSQGIDTDGDGFYPIDWSGDQDLDNNEAMVNGCGAL